MLKSMLLELLIYIIGYFVFIIASIIIYKKSKNKNFAAVIITLMLIVYASIRYNVGSDYDSYYKQYNEIFYYFKDFKQIFSSDIQYGFSILMFLVKKIFNDQYSIFTVVALLVYPYTIYVMKKNSNNFLESLFLYFTLQFHMVSLNLLKQVISMTIFFKNYNNILKDKIMSFIICSYLMITFHFSSIFSIIVLIISKYINPTIKKMFISIFASFILLFLYKSAILNIDFFDRYERYISNINREYYIQTIGAIGYFIINMIILFKLLKNKNELIKINSNNKVILSALILIIPFKVLAIDNFPIYRISLYIDQFLIFIIPDLISVYKEKYSKAKFTKTYMFYILLMFVWLCFEIIFIPHNNFYEYHTIFSRKW